VTLHHERRGDGRPLLLVHGLGSRGASWGPVLAPLARERQLVLVDLPGHGRSPELAGEPSVARIADELETFLAAEELTGIDAVGSSLGARLVLELARRRAVGDVVALDPGGFWTPGEVRLFRTSLKASIALVRALRSVAPALVANPVTRTLLFAQLSARPWALSPEIALAELRSLADTPAFDRTLEALATGPVQEGAPAGTLPGRTTIAWGRRDAVTLPRQAARAVAAFPDAELVWVERSGHFPHLDRPAAATDLILSSTGRRGSAVG
jgi:pimeloyl-ACP methyl ester carboxylesterase